MLSSNQIIAMLRELHKDANNPLDTCVAMRIAAEEIERLSARVAELEAERAPAP